MNLQKIWADPVWSKVISGGILALVAAIYASAHWWTVLSAALIKSWSYAGEDVATPRWAYWVLLLWAVGTIIVLALALIASTGETEAHWNTYKEDEFFNLRWRWRMDGEGYPYDICAFCPACDYQLDVDYDPSYYAEPHTTYSCPHCARTSMPFNESRSDVENRVVRSIQLALRNGSWKNAKRKG